ncbi:hypothetical protein [Pseudomonas sp. LY10J]|uniref:hypothetical protein n=1 Tax=Pseudomonas sp. LY10J TaxID=2787783 RepID=UPI0018A12A66|nr:hypothetical protein [Pseudomonas sp. LY10J]MBF7144343.1 hypothetical protein [Pseudomonas sp. LY10J]
MRDDLELAKAIVASEDYIRLVIELQKETGMKLIEGYEDLIAALDGAAILRAELTASDFDELFSTQRAEIKKYSLNKYKMIHGFADEQDYSRGGEPCTLDKKDNMISKGYSLSFLLGNGIEFLMAKKGKSNLEGYLKASRIPKAVSYAKKVVSFMS